MDAATALPVGLHVVYAMSALLTAAVLAALRIRVKRRFPLYWAAGYLSLAIAAASHAAISLLAPGENGSAATQLHLIATTAGFAWLALLSVGIRELATHRTPSTRVLACAVGGSVLAGGAAVLAFRDGSPASPTSLTVLAAAITGTAFLAGAYSLLRLGFSWREAGRPLVGVALAGFGIVQLAGAGSLVRWTVNAFAVSPQGIGIEIVLQTALTLGLLWWALDEDRRVASESIVQLDTLTGLPRRRLFLDRLNAVLLRARETGARPAVFFLDLDRFKAVNDLLGHAVGDHLLQTVALRIRRVIGDTYTVTRVGGDEFTILAPHVSEPAEALAVAERVRDAVRTPVMHAGTEINVGTSIGISIFPEDGNDAETLMKFADAALYIAKERGRDSVHLCTREQKDAARAQRDLETALARALDAKELALYYLPMVDMATGIVIAMEAQLRWIHPDRGLLAPAAFLGVAEAMGLLPRIGEWVIRSACAQLDEWRVAGHTDMRMNVNVGLRQLQQPELVPFLSRVIADTALPPASLDVDVTQDSIARGGEVALERLQQLKDLGVRISLDDFGTSHSSLAALRRYPADTLKIDRSFVGELFTSVNGAAIPTAVISLAHDLGLKVVAEGVETEEQLDFLRSHGCDAWQGHLFSAAAPACECASLLHGNPTVFPPRISMERVS